MDGEHYASKARRQTPVDAPARLLALQARRPGHRDTEKAFEQARFEDLAAPGGLGELFARRLIELADRERQ